MKGEVAGWETLDSLEYPERNANYLIFDAPSLLG
jgi:hypothetical protein